MDTTLLSRFRIRVLLNIDVLIICSILFVTWIKTLPVGDGLTSIRDVQKSKSEVLQPETGLQLATLSEGNSIGKLHHPSQKAATVFYYSPSILLRSRKFGFRPELCDNFL